MLVGRAGNFIYNFSVNNNNMLLSVKVLLLFVFIQTPRRESCKVGCSKRELIRGFDIRAEDILIRMFDWVLDR